MKKTVYSLLGIIVAIGNANAGIRVGNLSRNYAGTSKNTAALDQQYYNAAAAVSAMAAATEDVMVDVELPVRVADKELAEQIKRGDENARTDMDTLNKCATIYPDGEFIWDVPTIGRGAGGRATCVAVVEIRALGANAGREYTTVARGKLAAGDAVLCNISDFPAETYLPEINNVVFPADTGPTREDVIKVMNEEQKSKAGLKIAAAALVGGLGGNFVGKSDPGEDKMLGTNKEKMKTTAIGAAAGAALMAASTFSGKVAGDTILHGGVNAAAGGVIGNIAQSGASVLRVEKCMCDSRETTCLWGSLQNTKNVASDIEIYSTFDGKTVFSCEEKDGTKPCRKRNDLIVKKVAGEKVGKYKNLDEVLNNQNIEKYYYHSDYNLIKMPNDNSDSATYFTAEAEQVAGVATPAMICGFQDSAFGTKADSDAWEAWKGTHAKNIGNALCRRNAKGEATDCGKVTKPGSEELFSLDDFHPSVVDAEDGSVIDFSNKARLGATVKGAGVGGAIGAFSGYQGAQADIEDRLTQAIREYNDSLQKIYCGTGKKFISFYNDDAIIPAMKN